jgi:uncharacterized protein
MPMAPLPDFAQLPMAALAEWMDSDAPPPVDRWHPEREGRIDIRIAADGRWFHEGGEISRPAMVRLFSRILRREADGSHVLVTPAEKLTIIVEDAPFIAVEARFEGEGEHAQVAFRLNSGDMVMLGAEHPLRLRDGPAGLLPYLHVRGPSERALEARLARSVWYDCATRADGDGRLWSGGAAWPLGETG